MNIITIPKKLVKEDLIIISRKEYEQILGLLKKKYIKFDRDLDKMIEEIRQGKTIGPFSSVKLLRISLEK
ncbi:MAG: hypothetical protein AAB958_02655 [Patescibacteria group bacterium]